MLFETEWLLVSSTGKVSNGYIRNLGLNLRLHQNWLMSWSNDNKLSLGADAIDWNSLKNRYKSPGGSFTHIYT